MCVIIIGTSMIPSLSMEYKFGSFNQTDGFRQNPQTRKNLFLMSHQIGAIREWNHWVSHGDSWLGIYSFTALDH